MMKKRILFATLFLLLFIGIIDMGFASTKVNVTMDFKDLITYESMGKVYGLKSDDTLIDPVISFEISDDNLPGDVDINITDLSEEIEFEKKEFSIYLNSDLEFVFPNIVNDPETGTYEVLIEMNFTYSNGSTESLQKQIKLDIKELPIRVSTQSNNVVYAEPGENTIKKLNFNFECNNDNENNCEEFENKYYVNVTGKLYKHRDSCIDGDIISNKKIEGDYIEISKNLVYRGNTDREVRFEFPKISDDYTYQGFYYGEIYIIDNTGNKINSFNIYYTNKLGYLTGEDVCDYYEKYPVDKSNSITKTHYIHRGWTPFDFKKSFESISCDSTSNVIEDMTYLKKDTQNIDKGESTEYMENTYKITYGFEPRNAWVWAKYDYIVNLTCNEKPDSKLLVYNFMESHLDMNLKFDNRLEGVGISDVSNEEFIFGLKKPFIEGNNELKRVISAVTYNDLPNSKQVFDMSYAIMGTKDIEGEYITKIDAIYSTSSSKNNLLQIPIRIKYADDVSDIQPSSWTGTSSNVYQDTSGSDNVSSDDTTQQDIDSKLEIKNIKFNVGSRTNNINEDELYEEIRAQYGDSVEIEAYAYNNFNEDVKIEYVEMEVESDFDEEIFVTEQKTIDNGDREKFTVSFDLPENLEEDEYNVKLKVVGIDEYNDEHRDEIEFTIKIDIPPREIMIKEASLSPSVLSCTDTTSLTFEIMNIGEYDLDDVYVEIYSNSLSIRERITVPYEMESDVESDSRTYKKTVRISTELIEGTHDIQIRAYTRNTEKAGEALVLNVIECSEAIEPLPEVIAPAPEPIEEETPEIVSTSGLKKEDNTFVLLGLGAGIVVVMGGILFVLLKFII